MIKRDSYLNELVKAIDIGKTKIITGIRISSKSYLLFNIIKKHLIDSGIKEKTSINNKIVIILTCPLEDRIGYQMWKGDSRKC